MNTKNAYAPYGYHLPDQGVLGFNGEQLDPVTEHYHLGNGYASIHSLFDAVQQPGQLESVRSRWFERVCLLPGRPSELPGSKRS